MKAGRGLGAAAVVVVLGFLLGLGPASAGAAVPFKDIASAGPLTHVYIGNELSCQISHVGDTSYEPAGSVGIAALRECARRESNPRPAA